MPAISVQDIRIGSICTTCRTPPQPRVTSPPPSPAHMLDNTSNILQWNANGIGNKQTELSIFLEAHNVQVAAIQESKLTAQSRSPNIQNYTIVRQAQEEAYCFFKSITQSASLSGHCQQRRGMTPYLYLPASSCNGCYSPPLDHMLTDTDSLVLGDFNAHHSLRNNRYERQPTCGFNQYFQVCSHKYRFTYKVP